MAKIIQIIAVTAILLMAFLNVKAEASTTENMETFFDSEIPGIRIIRRNRINLCSKISNRHTIHRGS
jgi:hypothetical protein